MSFSPYPTAAKASIPRRSQEDVKVDKYWRGVSSGARSMKQKRASTGSMPAVNATIDFVQQQPRESQKQFQQEYGIILDKPEAPSSETQSNSRAMKEIQNGGDGDQAPVQMVGGFTRISDREASSNNLGEKISYTSYNRSSTRRNSSTKRSSKRGLSKDVEAYVRRTSYSNQV